MIFSNFEIFAHFTISNAYLITLKQRFYSISMYLHLTDYLDRSLLINFCPGRRNRRNLEEADSWLKKEFKYPIAVCKFARYFLSSSYWDVVLNWWFLRLNSWPDCKAISRDIASRQTLLWNSYRYLVHEEDAGSFDRKIKVLYILPLGLLYAWPSKNN